MPVPTRPDSVERASSSLWTWPAITAAAVALAAAALSRVRPEPGSIPAALWPGDAASASAVMQVVTTSVMSATALILSLTVIALQLASQQFSPRLLRAFAHDPVTKRVLSVLSGSFVFALASLAAMRDDQPVPAPSALLSTLLGVASLGAILAFISHLVRLLRVDTMMLMAHGETQAAIEAFYPPYGDGGAPPDDLVLDSDDSQVVASDASGFVRRVDVDALVEVAVRHDLLVRIDVRPGDHVVRGAPIAALWGRGGVRCRSIPDGLANDLRRCVRLGFERTIDQDAAFGFRQLEDIAVKAMSPSVNDPVTAAHAVGHMADLLVRLVGCRLGPTLHRDPGGVGRAIVPDRDLRYYLDLACGQLRRFAAAEPTVLVALLRMLRPVAAACRDDEQRAEVRRAARLVAEQAASPMATVDLESIVGMRERVDAALEGQIVNAYDDRTGETRSI